jgi:hypothetical protein
MEAAMNDDFWRRLEQGSETETVPHVMTNAMNPAEQHVIRLKPRDGHTAAEVQAFLIERIEEGKRIDAETCEIGRWYANAVDIYGIFEVPKEVMCVGNELFARNLPDGTWVWFGDLPEETCKALFDRMEDRRKREAETMSNTEHEFRDKNRHLVEVPDSFAIARWPRNAGSVEIARCILGTLKYEPHSADVTALRRALEQVIADGARS